jgi:hypothetical protein
MISDTHSPEPEPVDPVAIHVDLRRDWKSPIAILCNGPSLADHDLERIPCRTIGLNRSWELYESDFQAMADREQWQYYEAHRGPIEDLGSTLITGHDGPGDWRYKFVDCTVPGWSSNPAESVFLAGTITFPAMQIALGPTDKGGLGADTLYMVGFDLQGRPQRDGSYLGKFYGGIWRPRLEARQRELMGFVAGLQQGPLKGKSIYVVANDKHGDTRCRAFPILTFNEAFG